MNVDYVLKTLQGKSIILFLFYLRIVKLLYNCIINYDKDY